jgi:glycerophosphoryl diester phosphodiesterase
MLSRTPFAVVGHRGAASLEPENTIKSIKRAISLGVDVVEVDVRATRDSRLILLHDEDFTRISGIKVRVHDLTAGEVLSRVKIRGEKIPTLEEALAVVDGKVGVFIDYKEESTYYVGDLVDVIRKTGASEWVAVISFKEDVLRKVKELNPHVEIGISYDRPPIRVLEGKKLGCSIMLPHYKLATRRTVELAHKLGLKVVAWTVNDLKVARELVSQGIDAIASDRPDLIIKLKEVCRGR